MADVRIPVNNKSEMWRRFKAMCAHRDITVKELVKVLCERETERWEQEQKGKEK